MFKKAKVPKIGEARAVALLGYFGLALIEIRILRRRRRQRMLAVLDVRIADVVHQESVHNLGGFVSAVEVP